MPLRLRGFEMDLNSSGISGKDDNEKSSLTKSKLAPIAIQTVESGIAILAGKQTRAEVYWKKKQCNETICKIKTLK